jgi:HEAT repeat protein
MSKSIKHVAKIFTVLILTNCFLPNVQAKEPSYKGKALSEIICCSLPDDQYDAFTQLGTNCLPVVLDIMGATDKNMKWVAMGLKSEEFRDKAFNGDEGTLADIRESASRAFDMLGTNAAPAIPRLVKILNQNDEITSIYAADALGKVGSPGFVALTNVLNKAGGKANTRSAAISEIVKGDFKIVTPMLNGFLKDKDPDVRRFAAEALAGRDPNMAIPLLMPVLDDPDIDVKAAAAAALGSYGEKAKSALPKIVVGYIKSITDTNYSLYDCQSFSDALQAIDLDAAKQAEALVINSSKNPFRQEYTRTKLANGLELFAGGYIKSKFLFPTNHYLSSAELYDPKTGKWEETGEMAMARFGHAAVLIPDGDVLVIGGDNDKYHPQSSAELYDPQTRTWRKTGEMTTARNSLAATLLPGGRVLVAGGVGSNGGILSTAELYDSRTGSWTETGSLKNPNAGGQIILQPDGKALLVNGIDYPHGPLFFKELYDPVAGVWEEIMNK